MDTPAPSSTIAPKGPTGRVKGFSTVWKVLWTIRKLQVGWEEYLFDFGETAG